MPKGTIEVDNFELGLCWLNESLQASTKPGHKISDAELRQIQKLSTELVDFIPSREQRLQTVGALMKFVGVKSSKPLRLVVLSSLGELHALTPEARSMISVSLKDKDADVRGAAIVAAAHVDPTDSFFQKALVFAALHDRETMNRSAALDGLYLRSKEAMAAISTMAKTDPDEYLRGEAEVKLKDWQDHPSTEAYSSQAMAILGDSISVGFVADTTILEAQKYQVKPDQLNVLWLLSQGSRSEQLRRVWAGGDKFSSHYVKLKERLAELKKPSDVELYNVARAGAKTPELKTQITALAAQMLLKPKQKLIYVTLFMGSNDVCDGKSSDEINKNLSRALSRLNRLQDSRIVVLLVNLLPIYQLSDPKIANYPALAGLTCQAEQVEHFKFCNSFIKPATQEEAEGNRKLIESANVGISDLAGSQDFKNLRIINGKSLSQADLLPEMLAIDCFHPNQDGQQAISEALWEDVENAKIEW